MSPPGNGPSSVTSRKAQGRPSRERGRNLDPPGCENVKLDAILLEGVLVSYIVYAASGLRECRWHVVGGRWGVASRAGWADPACPQHLPLRPLLSSARGLGYASPAAARVCRMCKAMDCSVHEGCRCTPTWFSEAYEPSSLTLPAHHIQPDETVRVAVGGCCQSHCGNGGRY